MADLLSMLNEFMGGLGLNFANPFGLLMNVLLSTIVSGIVILIIVEIFAKKTSASVNPLHAFGVSLVISLINMFGVIALLGAFVAVLPFAGIIGMLLPVLVWLIILKLFFKDMGLGYILIISVICYLLSIFLIPSLVVMASGIVPV